MRLPATLPLPTGRNARQLLGLARRGLPLEPSRVVDDMAIYRVEGLFDEGPFEIAVCTPTHPDHRPEDDLAIETLTQAPTEERSVLELEVVLLWLLHHNGSAVPLRLQRVLDVLYGPRGRPERHNTPTKGWLAVFQRALVEFDPPGPPRGEKRKPSWSPWPGAGPATGRVLLALQDDVVTLEPTFGAALAAVTYDAPINTCRIDPPLDGKGEVVPNPEGNLPSWATRARVRLAAVMAIAPRRPGEQPRRAVEQELEPLMVSIGCDLQPIKDRRHQYKWGLELLAEVTTFCRKLGVTLLTEIKAGLSVLSSLLRIGRSIDDAPSVEGLPRHSSSRGPP